MIPSPRELCMRVVDGVACTRTAGHPPPCRRTWTGPPPNALPDDTVRRLREVAKSDAIEAGTRDAVERLVTFAAAQLAAGTLPGQVLADMLTTFTTAQAGDGELDGRTAAEGVEVIAAGAVLLLAQERQTRMPRRFP